MTIAIGRAIVTASDGSPLSADFPILAEVGGVPAVVISADRYRELLANASAGTFESPLKALRALRPRQMKPLPSPIERDPDVAAFLRERLNRADSIEAARRACEVKFGPERTPSRARVERFRTKERQR